MNKYEAFARLRESWDEFDYSTEIIDNKVCYVWDFIKDDNMIEADNEIAALWSYTTKAMGELTELRAKIFDLQDVIRERLKDDEQ